MTPLLLIPLLGGILALSSCAARNNAANKTQPTPPAPSPTVAAKPPSPPAPVSTPQTQVQLPPPQSVSPAALATIPLARETSPAPEPTQATKPPATKKSSTTPAAASAPPKTDTPAQTAEAPAPVQGPPTPTPPPAAAPGEEQPRLQPVYTEEERRRILGELERRKAEIESLLRGVNQNRLSSEKNTVDRIHSFISVAEDHAKRGDFRSADALSDRALILARELASGR